MRLEIRRLPRDHFESGRPLAAIQELLQLLNQEKVDETKTEEPLNAIDDEKLQNMVVASPKPRNAVLAPPAGMNIYTFNQPADVYAFRPLVADGSKGTPGNAFDHGDTGRPSLLRRRRRYVIVLLDKTRVTKIITESTKSS